MSSLEHGFLRVKCNVCQHELLVAFSCKRRGFCPSCGARRMVETAAPLVDHVLPERPVRQWVLSFPYPLRFLFAARPKVLTQVLGIATGPHAGRKALTLQSVPPATSTDKPYVARLAGFSIHAGIVCQAHQRGKLEHLGRYIARPPVANQRLSVNGAGQVVYSLKQPFRDGTTHVVMEPLDFIARLAALVARPRANLIRYHGVFAPNFRHRNKIVPRRSRIGQRESDKPTAPLTLRGPPGCSD